MSGHLARLAAQLLRATEITLWALTQQDELNNDASDAGRGGWEDGDGDGGGDGGGGSLGPEAQVVITGCWLTMKEVSLLTGALFRHVPLPGGLEFRSGKPVAADEVVLALPQVEALSENVVRLMLTAKHNGTVEKAQQGLTTVVHTVLKSSDPAVNALPRRWLAAALAKAAAPGQTLKVGGGGAGATNCRGHAGAEPQPEAVPSP